ncbi:MAG: hypothetical protein IKF19_02045 [Bacilli bacterium]|nr:hypothetical protein [Bacilli bacterium]
MFIKKIVINSDSDLKSFYRKLFIYKSFLYLGVKFVSDDERLKDIVKALNIKNRIKRIDYVYDSACSYVDDYWNDKNICGFVNNKCHTQKGKNSKFENGCCRRCFYQSNKGCITSNLTCKLYFCEEVKKRYTVPTYKDIKILKLLTFRQRIVLNHDYFSSREEILMDLYIGSVIIFLIRLLFRYAVKNIT